MPIEQLYQHYQKTTGPCTDTRKLQAGNMFFALKGPSFNGNTFAEQALKDGAMYAVIDEEEYYREGPYILVDDVLATLQNLARYHREQFNIPFIGITGSNGKTTTKELIRDVLARHFKVVATVGNLNNHIGVPLTLLSVETDTEIAIIEMGANHVGEIASYCQWAQPTHGLITNIGKAHLEGFGGIEGVIKGKTELYNWLAQQQGTVFYNADDELLSEKSGGIGTRISYGQNEEADYRGSFSPQNEILKVELQSGATVATHLTGNYNFHNLMAAYCIGSYFGVEESAMIAALESYNPTNNRSQIMHKGSNTYIMDAYNANPSSMREALINLGKTKGEQKIAILGDMLELGVYSAREHTAIIEQASQMELNACFFVGKAFGDQATTFGKYFENAPLLKDYLQQQPIENSTVLIKGSRGIKLEQILE